MTRRFEAVAKKPYTHQGDGRRPPRWVSSCPVALVAQLDRVLPSEGSGRGFESRRVRHLLLPLCHKGLALLTEACPSPESRFCH